MTILKNKRRDKMFFKNIFKNDYFLPLDKQRILSKHYDIAERGQACNMYSLVAKAKICAKQADE